MQMTIMQIVVAGPGNPAFACDEAKLWPFKLMRRRTKASKWKDRQPENGKLSHTIFRIRFDEYANRLKCATPKKYDDVAGQKVC